VNTSLVNGADTFTTKGTDVQIEYGFDLDEIFKGAPGALSFDGLYTFADQYGTEPSNFVGTTEAGIGSAIPDFKAVTTIQYIIGDWLFQARHSYVPGLKQDYPGGTFDGTKAPDTPEFSNLDIAARWDITDHFRIAANIDNVFNEFPPQTVTGFFDQANTDAALYAPWVIGRTWSLSGRIKF
jgi:outer membrane receptor protein involved in Fe transport